MSLIFLRLRILLFNFCVGEGVFLDVIGTEILNLLCTGDPYYVLYTALSILKCSEEIHYVPIGAGDM